MGSAHQRAAAGKLLCQYPARCDGRRFMRIERCLLRHHRRPGLCFARFRRHLADHRARPAARACRSKFRHCHDPRTSCPAICARLPGAARKSSSTCPRRSPSVRCSMRWKPPIPTLRGTIRDQQTKERRPLVRFFACKQDLSHESLDSLLPDEVVSGREPYMIVGAMAGG